MECNMTEEVLMLTTGSIETGSTATIRSTDGMGESITAQETGHSKRKRIAKQNTSDALNGCSMVLDSECNKMLKCKRVGCKTQCVSINFAQGITTTYLFFSTTYNVLCWR